MVVRFFNKMVNSELFPQMFIFFIVRIYPNSEGLFIIRFHFQIKNKLNSSYLLIICETDDGRCKSFYRFELSLKMSDI